MQSLVELKSIELILVLIQYRYSTELLEDLLSCTFLFDPLDFSTKIVENIVYFIKVCKFQICPLNNFTNVL